MLVLHVLAAHPPAKVMMPCTSSFGENHSLIQHHELCAASDHKISSDSDCIFCFLEVTKSRHLIVLPQPKMLLKCCFVENLFDVYIS